VLLGGRITTTRRKPRNHGGVPEDRLPVFTEDCLRSTTTLSGGCSATKLRPATFRIPCRSRTVWKNPTARTRRARCGGEVCGAASQPGGAGTIELQVRPRRALYTVVEEIVEHSGTPTSVSRTSTRTSHGEGKIPLTPMIFVGTAVPVPEALMVAVRWYCRRSPSPSAVRCHRHGSERHRHPWLPPAANRSAPRSAESGRIRDVRHVSVTLPLW